MDADFAAALAEWHDFFATIAGVSGTLVGLLFVALGLNPAIMADDSPAGLRVWSGQTFNSLLSTLIIGLAGLVPAAGGPTLAITLAITGVQGIARVIGDLRQVSADRDPNWTLRHVITRFISPSLAYLFCLWLSWRVWNDDADSLGWLVAIVFLLTLNAASSCWDLLKEIGVRHREDVRRKSEVGVGMTERGIRVATFDCYGTLADWEGGLGSFLYAVALEHEAQPQENGRAMRERWEALQFAIIQGEYRPYKEVLAESLRAWMTERGYPWDAARGEALVRAMRSWQPFPDTRPALAQARQAGLRLVILSNTDNDIIAQTLRQLEIPFSDVITAEDCRSYKPSLNNFQQMLSRVGESPERILHVAFGFKYDIGPAQRLGMQAAWVNRHVEPAPGAERPDHVWRDLWGLAALMGGRGPGMA